jgi:hypothetical protein
MKATVYYRIEQFNAIKAGKSAWGEMKIEVDPAEVPEHLREELALVADMKYFDSYPHNDIAIIEPLTQDQLFQWLEYRIEQKKKSRAKEEQRKKEKIEQERKKEQERITKTREAISAGCRDIHKLTNLLGFSQNSFSLDYNFPSHLPDDITTVLRDLLTEKKQEKERKEQEEIELEQRQEQRQEQRAEYRIIALSDAVALQDENTRERWEAKLIPDQEKSEIINAFLFQSDFPSYRRLKTHDVLHDQDCAALYDTDRSYISFDTEKPEGVTKEEWSTFKEIKEAFSNQRRGHLEITYLHELINHVATCENCERQADRLAVKVSACVNDVEIATKHFAI